MLEKLQKKSKKERQTIAYVSTFVFGIFIFAAWMFVAGHNMKQAMLPKETSESKIRESIKKSIPSIKQTDSVTTDLIKQKKRNTETVNEQEGESEQDEKKKTLFQKLFR